MINFRHITLASNFYTTKFSANRQNTEYTVGNRTDRIVQGTPSVLYDEVVFCKELKIIYTHGAFYEANSAQFDLDGFVTKGELINNYVNKTDLDNYYTKLQTDNTFVKKSTLENNYYDKDTTFDLFVTKNRLISDYYNKSDIDENYYTKRQTNNLLDQKQDIISGEGVISVENNVVKADLSNYYNKSEVGAKLDQKQDIISGEGVISVEDNVVKADLSDYYNKSEVYTKQETDSLLDQKQDIISGEGVISVENNVVSVDLSDYYNKETVDNKLDTKQNLISGNPGEVLYHNGSDVFTQEVLGENLVVTTQTDLDKCKNISVVDPSFVIFDLVNSAVLTFDSATSSWLPVAGQNPIELLGAGRFSYNNVTNKLFYNNGTNVIELTSKYYAGNNIEIEDNTISATIDTDDIDLSDYYKKSEINTKLTNYYTKSEVNSEFDNLATVASTGSYNDLVDTPELQNLTAGENIEITDNVISAVDTKYTAGEGIEIDEDNKISLVQEEKITEKPAEDDQEVNVFYNYNGVKVVVPKGKGYFNLLHNYVIPDAVDGDQIFPKGLYIEDDTILAPNGINSIYGYRFDGFEYEINLSDELIQAVTEGGYTVMEVKSRLSVYANCVTTDGTVSLDHYNSGKYAILPTVDLGTWDIRKHSSVNPSYQVLRLNDYYIDIFGNVYKINEITSYGSGSYTYTINFKYKLVLKARTSIPITLAGMISAPSDDLTTILTQFVGSEIATLDINEVSTKTCNISMYDNYSWRNSGKLTEFVFKSAYKNESDQLCYIYGDTDDKYSLAMTLRKVKRTPDSQFTNRITFCGFLTFGSEYSVEIPIQYTTDTTELQGFSWTNKGSAFDSSFSDVSINAVQNKVITGELAKLRTEFVTHLTELPINYDENAIVQYIGENNDLFTNGYFYKYDNIIIPPNTNYISLNNDYPKFKRGVYTEIENPTNFSSLGIVQVIPDNFYGDYTIAEGQDEYGTLSNFPSIRFDFFGVPDKTDGAELMKGLDYIQVGELAADEAGNLYRISEVDPSSRIPTIKVKLEIYRLAYDFTLKRNSEPDVTYKLSNVLSQILSETWISIQLESGTSIQYSLFKTFANYRGDIIYAYKYSSGTSMTGPIYCCSTKLVDGVVRPTFAGFLYWSNWVQTIYIETGSLTIKPQIYTSGNVSVTSEHLGWSQIDVQPNSGGGVISYNDLIDKPTIPTKTSQLTNDSEFSTFSGSYNDLIDKPTIPQVDDALSDSSSNAVENRVVKSAIDNKITNGGGVTTEIALTKSEYNSIPTKDDNTVYIITDEPVDESNVVFKVCVVGQNTTNISDLVQPYSLIPNNVVILTNLEDNKTYEYTLNNSTKTFEGNSEHDMLFRYIGNNEFKPIVFGTL